MNPKHFYNAYTFIHLAPHHRQSERVLGCSKSTIHTKIKPLLHHLASVLTEIHWEDRLSPYNHAPDFPVLFTGIVDTQPIYVAQPKNTTLRTALYNPKYGDTVYKVMQIIDFMGRRIAFSGPHLGTFYDAHAFLSTYDQHPLLPWEYLIGDGHFTSIPQILCPYRSPPNGRLSLDQHVINAVISHYRSRVEHSNHLFNQHATFQQPWRGSVQLLHDITHVSAHTGNVELHRYIRYPPFGPWSHIPSL